MWQAYLENWYLWTMLVSWLPTALLFCSMHAHSYPKSTIEGDTVMGLTFLAIFAQIVWPLIWTVCILILIGGMWVSLVQWLMSPSNKGAEKIVEKEIRRVINDIKQG